MLKNQFKTAVLLGLLTALLLWVGQFFGGMSGLILAGIIVGLMNFAMYFWSDKIVLWMYKAKEVKEKDHPELFSVVRETAQLAGVPMPKVYIVPSDQPNAFATGRNPKHAAVAATTGILKMLKKDELKGVMAHELSHVKNRDTLIQTVSGTIAGVIGFVGSMARWSAIFGGSDEDNGGIVGLLVIGILTPIMAVIIQLAISRSREYLADETAAKMLHSGLSLAAALEKLEKSAKEVPMRLGGPATENLFIVSPFRGGGMMSWLSTHPPMEKRIMRLRNMRF
jgi:heat shock protein HtpX